MTKKLNDLEIKFQTALGEADENTVDKWELMASRRALKNLKSLITEEQMEQFIAGEMEENDRRIREYLSASNGDFKEVFVEVEVEGITATKYFEWQSQAMKNAITGSSEERNYVLNNVVFPSHPEHYLLLKSGIVETLGGLPTNASVVKVDPMPQFVLDARDESYPHKSFSGIKLKDDTVWGYGLTEYKDTENGGGKFRLHVWWPAAAPQIFFDDHARHFAVEYRNFIHMAVQDMNKK